VRGRDSIQKEIFTGQRILSREGRGRSNNGSDVPEGLMQRHAEAVQKPRGSLKFAEGIRVSEAETQGVRLRGRNRITWVANQPARRLKLG